MQLAEVYAVSAAIDCEIEFGHIKSQLQLSDGIIIIQRINHARLVGITCIGNGLPCSAHIAVIRENCRKVERTGVECDMEILQGDVLNVSLYARAEADLIFADPPYAESGRFFRELTANAAFQSAFEGALLVWEIPDTPGARGDFINAPDFDDGALRNLGGVWFFIGTVKKS